MDNRLDKIISSMELGLWYGYIREYPILGNTCDVHNLLLSD